MSQTGATNKSDEDGIGGIGRTDTGGSSSGGGCGGVQVRLEPRETTPLLSVRIHDVDQDGGSVVGSGASVSGVVGGGTFDSGCFVRTPNGTLAVPGASGFDAEGLPLPLPFSPKPKHFQLYVTRWYVLALFAIMALFNNALCYTVGSVYRVSRRYYFGGVGPVDNEETTDLSTLVSCFFITYCISSFPASWFVERYGLRAGVLLGAWLQAVGCAIRVVATPSVPHPVDDETPHGDLTLLMTGQVIASLGQGFWVNTPALLAASWFPVSERTLATTIACNANTLGIAVAFVIGPAIVDSVDDLPLLMWIVAGATLATALMSSVYFPSAPPTPPSHSQVEPQEILAAAPEPPTSDMPANSSDSALWAAHERVRNNNNCSVVVGVGSSSDELSASPDDAPRVALSASPDSSALSSDSESEEERDADVEAARVVDRSQTQLSHSHSAPSVSSVGRHSHSHPSDPHHLRVRSQSELAVADSYRTMTSPPCLFVRRSAILAERQRSKNASRILASVLVFKKMFASAGFGHALLAFGVAEATINGFAAFMSMIVEPWGYTSMQFVGGVVVAFICSGMVGSAVIGWLVDRNKAFKSYIMACLIASAATLLYLLYFGPISSAHIWVSVALMGFAMGPVQPLAIETAVEVSYPAPESSVTAMMQMLANLFSAAVFPLIVLCRNPITKSMQPALFLILFCLLGTGLFYATFDGVYRRLAHENHKEKQHRDLHRRLHEEAHRKRVAAVRQALLAKLRQSAKAEADAAAAAATQPDS